MKVILLERVGRTGHIGDEVAVKDGFARNFLLPQGKALRATEANRKRFEAERQNIEKRNQERREEASKVAAGIDGVSVVIIRQAGETGQLYGSVSARDVADSLSAAGHPVARSQVSLANPIKTVGIHHVALHLHAEVEINVTVNVARSEDEATRQSKGEDLTVPSFGDLDEEEEEAVEDEISEGAPTADGADEAR